MFYFIIPRMVKGDLMRMVIKKKTVNMKVKLKMDYQMDRGNILSQKELRIMLEVL